MVTDHLNTTASLFDLFHESELCPNEILTIFQTLDDNIDIYNASTTAAPGPLMDEKNSSINNKNKRMKKPAKTASSSPGFGSDEESDEDPALFSQRKRVKRQKASPPAISMEDGNGEDGGGADGSNNNGKVVSHITVERNRRKQMNEHLAVLRQLMPCFYVKKGDQASIIGGVIDYINELQQVLQSLEAKKQRMIYTNEVGQSPILLVPQQQSNPSPLINLPVSPVTPQSTSPYKPLRQPLIQSTSITSPTSNTNSYFSSIADMISTMMNIYNNNISNNAVANELVASSNNSIADVEVKFCGPNLELKTLSPKLVGQTVKIVSAIEDLGLEILQVSTNTVEETMLNAFTIKIGIECQLSAEELAQLIQQTFC